MCRPSLSVVYLSHFCNTSTKGGGYHSLPPQICCKESDSFDFGTRGNVFPLIPKSTNSPSFDVRSESGKTGFCGFLMKIGQNFKFSPEILGISDFVFVFVCLFVCLFVFLLIVKRNDYYNMHRKFQAHSSNIFV